MGRLMGFAGLLWLCSCTILFESGDTDAGPHNTDASRDGRDTPTPVVATSLPFSLNGQTIVPILQDTQLALIFATHTDPGLAVEILDNNGVGIAADPIEVADLMSAQTTLLRADNLIAGASLRITLTGEATGGVLLLNNVGMLQNELDINVDPPKTRSSGMHLEDFPARLGAYNAIGVSHSQDADASTLQDSLWEDRSGPSSFGFGSSDPNIELNLAGSGDFHLIRVSANPQQP